MIENEEPRYDLHIIYFSYCIRIFAINFSFLHTKWKHHIFRSKPAIISILQKTKHVSESNCHEKYDKRKSYESCSKYISCLIKRNERFSEIKKKKSCMWLSEYLWCTRCWKLCKNVFIKIKNYNNRDCIILMRKMNQIWRIDGGKIIICLKKKYGKFYNLSHGVTK